VKSAIGLGTELPFTRMNHRGRFTSVVKTSGNAVASANGLAAVDVALAFGDPPLLPDELHPDSAAIPTATTINSTSNPGLGRLRFLSAYVGDISCSSPNVINGAV
ncbi:MAG: hypothetical protein Q7S58_02955, partial [Candidatus Binatus sp.]|uniref:hypothetical protein n=1 Tax=Candidatus Binatus sp. TaxID=2811406 RepID=UPI0027214E2C